MVSPGAPVRPVKPVKPGAKTTPGLPVFPVPTGTPVITGHTGQKALEAQDTQFLDRSEPIVQNSPVRPVQLEHNGCVFFGYVTAYAAASPAPPRHWGISLPAYAGLRRSHDRG